MKLTLILPDSASVIELFVKFAPAKGSGALFRIAHDSLTGVKDGNIITVSKDGIKMREAENEL